MDILTTVIAFVAAMAMFLVQRVARAALARTFEKSIGAERDRLRTNVLGGDATASSSGAVAISGRSAVAAGGDATGHIELSSERLPVVVADILDDGDPGVSTEYRRTDDVVPVSGRQRIDDDRFAELLIEYYAYGLTQARNSFLTSQWFAGVGASILLVGVGLGIWRAETTGDLYLGIVTSSVGAVTTLIGILFHRRADIALRHMALQTDSLRDDMRSERSTEQAILLLSEVHDPAVKARLQAGLIMKLSGSTLPAFDAPPEIPSPRTDVDASAERR